MMFFYQKPYIWQRPLFWIILIFAMVGTGIGYFLWREQKIKRENLRLEALVQERTADLKIEKDKSDMLLRSILPDKIADKLRNISGDKSFGEDFENVTVLFSDIVGFTKVSSGHKAQEIVRALNDLFSRFDERAKNMGVEKIKTIGDAYMAACGVPEPNENHARIMIDFAKGMLEDLANYNKTADIQFQVRIGLNCGPATAGVIGTHKFIYDVWGNTVNVASRMETAASPGGIRITEDLFNQLSKQKGLKFSDAIECQVKGKVHMKTYEVL
jgi:class 3 adenylate cyclase